MAQTHRQINKARVPVQTDPETGEEFVIFEDCRSGELVSMSASGASLFGGKGSQYPLPESVEEALLSDFFERGPFIRLPEEEQKEVMRAVIEAVIRHEQEFALTEI